jgi:hypothetical protein
MVTYGGVPNSSLGNASLALQGGQLVAGNLGSSGQDGVSVALPPGLTGWGAQWVPLDQVGKLPVGAYLQERVLGAFGGVADALLGTVTMTKAGTTNYVLSADLSPIGAGSVLLQAYLGGSPRA